MTLQQLCRHIIGVLHAPVHVYDESGDLITAYEDCIEQPDLLTSDPTFRNRVLELAKKGSPRLYLEGKDILYGIVHEEASIYLLGPCCISSDVGSAAVDLQHLHGLSADDSYSMNSVSLELFSHMLLMLSEMISDQSMDMGQLLLSSFCDEPMLERMDNHVHQIIYNNQEKTTLHNPYQQELREQGSIRTGDLDMLMESFKEVYVGKIGQMSSDPLTQSKYNAAAVIAVACRSAISGGLSPEVAYSLSDAYFQKMDEQQNVAMVTAVMRQAEIAYCKKVHELSKSQDDSPIITSCKDLITQQLHSKITVQGLAEQLGLSPKYLSSVFSQKTGITLKDYIIKEKIQAAKKQLIYTDDSCDSIACTYAFSSQSHFGMEFKKLEGMTPGHFRKMYGKARG